MEKNINLKLSAHLYMLTHAVKMLKGADLPLEQR